MTLPMPPSHSQMNSLFFLHSYCFQRFLKQNIQADHDNRLFHYWKLNIIHASDNYLCLTCLSLTFIYLLVHALNSYLPGAHHAFDSWPTLQRIKNVNLTGFNFTSYLKYNEMHGHIYFTPNVSGSKMKDKDCERVKMLFTQAQYSEEVPVPTQTEDASAS